MRVAYVTYNDVANAGHTSGMAYSSYRALSRLLPDMQLAWVQDDLPPRRTLWTRAHGRAMRLGIVQRLASPSLRRRHLARAERVGAEIRRQLREMGAEAVVCAFAGRCLYGEPLRIPVIYASDATAGLLNRTHYLHHFAPGLKQATEEVERGIARNTTAGAFASEATLKSAVDDFGYDRERSRVVPLGANLLPPEGFRIPCDPPTRQNTQLIIIAADPVRKRVGLCIDAAEILRSRGVRTTLHVVGGHIPQLDHTQVAVYHGRLRLSDPAERSKLVGLVSASHFLLLPSIAEMFGIAPAEAAHFGRPSLVSNAGGLPTVVCHDQTGIILDVSATAAQYAEQIVRLVDDPDRYAALAAAARQRAMQTFTWDAWAVQIRQMLDTAI